MFAELFYGMLEKMKLGVALTDGKGRFLAANPAFCAFIGYTAEELLSKTVSDVTPPEDLPAEGRRIREGRSDSQRFDKRYVAKDGRILSARLTCNVIRNVTGEVEYALGIIEDLSQPLPEPHVQGCDGNVSHAAGDTGSKTRVQGRPQLTPREEEGLELLMTGKSLKQIASIKEVTVQSVWKHQQRILSKFAVENDVELVRLILMSPPDSPSAANKSH